MLSLFPLSFPFTRSLSKRGTCPLSYFAINFPGENLQPRQITQHFRFILFFQLTATMNIHHKDHYACSNPEMTGIDGNPTDVEYMAASQLVWAVPITLESFIIGYQTHCGSNIPMRAFRKSILIPKQTEHGQCTMVPRLPEEIICLIGDFLTSAVHDWCA